MRTIAVLVTTLAATVLTTPAADAGQRQVVSCPRATFDSHATCTVVQPRR